MSSELWWSIMKLARKNKINCSEQVRRILEKELSND